MRSKLLWFTTMQLHSNKSLTRGFTLIELLISISILIFLAAGLYSAYREVSRRAVFDNTYRELKTNLSAVRQEALSGVRPAGCTGPLTAYIVTFTASSYTGAAVCGVTINTRVFNLPTSVTFTVRPVSISYKVIADGVTISPTGSNTITVQTSIGGTQTRTITINNQGLIQ